jgi:2',3'-cyclic-nucleotide 2'-phosphodiesterase (5'-nucleotidase family)
VDIIVSGHDHALLGNPADIEKVVAVQKDRVKGPYPTVIKDRDGNNTLVVSAYEWGRWLGQIKVTFDANGLIEDGAWQGNPLFVRGCDNTDCSKEAAPEDLTLKAKVAEYKAPDHCIEQRHHRPDRQWLSTEPANRDCARRRCRWAI